MCVIAVAPQDVEIPNDNLMFDMFDHNNDGAGIAYVLNNRVYVEKGFMEYRDFERALAGIEKRLKKANKTTKEILMAFHFRIGTHGPNSAPLTHPFPITTKTKLFDALDLKTDVIMMHNGIINTVTPKNGVSDTVQYVRDIMYPLYLNSPKFFKNQNYKKLMENTNDSSRFLILDKDSEFELIGTWVNSNKAPGVFFSNLNHEYTYNYRYSALAHSTHVGNKEFIYMRELPAGYYRGIDLDGALSEKDVAIIPENKSIKYFVDNIGNVYFQDSYFKDVEVAYSYYYDVAYADRGEHYEMITSDHPDLVKKPLYAKRLHGKGDIYGFNGYGF